MKRLALTFLLLLLPVAAHASAEGGWADCKYDSECVITEGVCNPNAIVNKKYLSEYKKHVASLKMTCDEENTGQTFYNETPYCLKGVCVINTPDFVRHQ